MLPDFYSGNDLEHLKEQQRKLLQATLEKAQRSDDPLVAEIGREIGRGSITPRDALLGSAYGEFLQGKVDGEVQRYLELPAEERQRVDDAELWTEQDEREYEEERRRETEQRDQLLRDQGWQRRRR